MQPERQVRFGLDNVVLVNKAVTAERPSASHDNGEIPDSQVPLIPAIGDRAMAGLVQFDAHREAFSEALATIYK